MRLLVEQFYYKATDLEKGIRALGRESGGKICWNEVGYYLSADLHDCVFILPKVVLWKEDAEGHALATEKVFGKYDPVDFVCPEKCKMSKEEKRFVYGFSTWIYRALKVFKREHPDSDIIYDKDMPRVRRTGRRRRSETLLDVLLSIEDFARENRDFFFFVVKNRRSGLNKINWTRTVAKSSVVINDDIPLYIDPINKKRQINFDEELLVIFFSILNYMNEKYGFSVPLDLGYELIKGAKFRNYVEKGLGKRRLLAIKYKYFSDKALRLWDLCYAFFECEHRIYLKADHEEYLLAKKFDRVFEAMIDKLVGDGKDELPKALTKQEDGRLVDHMYLYRDLIENPAEDIKTFYIGDSKYYKRGESIGRKDVAKQFEYARNVIQWRLNLFLDNVGDADAEDLEADKTKFVNGRKIGEIRDKVTEGYDVTPNFFISATMRSALRCGFRDGKITPKLDQNGQPLVRMARQFENRLFDRDTLIIAHYDVNFLFVLSLYAQDKSFRQGGWKSRVRKMFRKEIQDYLSAHYNFWAMTPKVEGAERTFLASDFQKVLGKVYKPYHDDSQQRKYYSLALERSMDAAGRNDIVSWLEKGFLVEECPLGTSPVAKLASKVAAWDRVRRVETGYDVVSTVQVAYAIKGHFYDAVKASGLCPCPADECKFPENVKVLVLPYSGGAHMFKVKDGTQFSMWTQNEVSAGILGQEFEGVSLPPCADYYVWHVEEVVHE